MRATTSSRHHAANSAAVFLCAASLLTPALRAQCGPDAVVDDAFFIDDFTTGSQSAPVVRPLSDGSFRVVWHGAGPDSAEGVRTLRVQDDGSAVFPVIRLDDGTVQPQDVALAATGSDQSIVTWRDGLATQLSGRRVDAYGLPVGASFQVNSLTSGSRLDPVVASAGDGSFVVAWTDYEADQSSSSVVLRTFDAAGVASGPETVVNTYTTSVQKSPTIAAAADGSFLIAWEGAGFDDNLEITAKLSSGDGSVTTPNLRVNAQTAGWQGNPRVAPAPHGEFLLAWESEDIENDDFDGAGLDIYFQRFDAGFQPVGSQFRINEVAAGDQSRVDLAVAPDGNWFATWTHNDADGVNAIAGRRFSPLDEPVGGDVILSQGATFPNLSSVALAADNSILVVWQDDSDVVGRGLRTNGIGDRVLRDNNLSLSQDPGDSGLEGVSVHLISDFGEVLQSTVSDADGS